ncbi:glycosyltransferase 87 family protein [Pedococcus sp. KACC 23699]|uniref:Glycosyltransferase 87 family protein n=1 Tax=Pedococcus sp. KACC 23699 TaxID=3149228 RepID=A0AAU7JY21_9MICO
MTQREDLLPSGSLAVAGGPLGRHASARAASWPLTVLPLLVAGAATMALSVLERAHCIQKGWVGSDQFWHACFSDLPAQYQLGNLDQGLAAYVGGTGARADHPVLTGSVMAWLGGFVPDGAFLDQTRWYFALWAILGTVLVVAMVWLTAASRPHRASLAAQVALSPVLLLAAMVSSDLFGVALVSAGIWAWSRRRPVAAGVFLGLAVTARVYPLLILLALVLLGLRAGRLAVVGRTLLAAAGAMALVLLPFLVGNPSAILRSTHVWWDSAAGLGSVWMLPQLLGAPLPTSATTAAALIALVLALGAGAIFALGTPRRPTLAEVSLVLVALALLAGKAFPVQSSLWLVPLVALCGLRWRDHLIWATAEALHFVAVWLYVAGLSTPDRGLPAGWYAVFLVVRVVAVGYLVWRVWHTAAARPAEPVAILESLSDPADQDASDPSKSAAGGDADEDPDELEGEFAGAPDRVLVRLA